MGAYNVLSDIQCISAVSGDTHCYCAHQYPATVHCLPYKPLKLNVALDWGRNTHLSGTGGKGSASCEAS